MTKTFRIASVSAGANSFGFHGHILVARDGVAYEVARNRGPHNPGWNKHDDVSIPTDEFGDPRWAMASCEIPRRLPDCPENVLKELFGADFKLTFPKSNGLLERAKAGVKMAVAQEDSVAEFVVNKVAWDKLVEERPPAFTTDTKNPAILAALFNVPLSVDENSKSEISMKMLVQL